MKELDLINNMLALPTIVENGSVTTDEFGRPVEPPRINMLEVNLRKSIQEAKLAEDVTENKSSDEVDVISSIVGIDEGARQSYGDPRQLSKDDLLLRILKEDQKVIMVEDLHLFLREIIPSEKL